MKTIIVMRGIAGSGKTTYIQKNFPNAVIASADNYFVHDGVYQFNPAKLGAAHQFSFSTFVDALNRGVDEIVVDNTNTKLWEFESYVSSAMDRGYDVKVIRLVVDATTAANRNLHGVPTEKVQQMYDRFQDFPGEMIVNTASKKQE